MKNAAWLSDNDKRILFRNTADKMGLSARHAKRLHRMALNVLVCPL